MIEAPTIEEFRTRRRAMRTGKANPDNHGCAVYASTADHLEQHYLGWLGDIDPDELFANGQAWGILLRRQPRELHPWQMHMPHRIAA